MNEDLTVEESKHILRRYLSLGQRIQELKTLKKMVSPYFYATQSFVGVGCTDNDVPHEFQRGVDPEYGAIEIISQEIAIQKQIDRLEQRYGLFNDKLPTLNRKRLLQLQKAETLHKEEKEVLEVVATVESEIRGVYQEEQAIEQIDKRKEKTKIITEWLNSKEWEKENVFDKINEVMNL